jgi:hypothetical protein
MRVQMGQRHIPVQVIGSQMVKDAFTTAALSCHFIIHSLGSQSQSLAFALCNGNRGGWVYM